METKIVRVSGVSDVSRTAGAIAKMIRGGYSVMVQSIGLAATNRAVKAITLACQYLLADRIIALFYPEFMEADSGDKPGLYGIRFSLALLSTVTTVDLSQELGDVSPMLDPDVANTIRQLLRNEWKTQAGPKPPVDLSGYDLGLN